MRPQSAAFDIGATEVAPSDLPTLANISTRLPVQTGDNVLIGGFIVTGTQPKKVIIRALGPSVPVPGTLADPTLELYQGNTFLESNDNWVDSPNKQAIVDSTVPPSNNLEAAIVRTLPGGFALQVPADLLPLPREVGFRRMVRRDYSRRIIRGALREYSRS